MIYEHLGNPITDDLFEIHEIVDYLNKPKGGLWGSILKEKGNKETEGYITWREWVECENFHPERYLRMENQHKFKLKNNANIFVLDGRKVTPDHSGSIRGTLSISDIDILLNHDMCILTQVSGDLFRRVYNIDWNYVMDKYDGFELIHGNCYNLFHFDAFNSWDCDSIVIWNKDAVEVIR